MILTSWAMLLSINGLYFRANNGLCLPAIKSPNQDINFIMKSKFLDSFHIEM